MLYPAVQVSNPWVSIFGRGLVHQRNPFETGTEAERKHGPLAAAGLQSWVNLALSNNRPRNPLVHHDFPISQVLHVWNIYLHWVIFWANVGKYSIHGASGYVQRFSLMKNDHSWVYPIFRHIHSTSWWQWWALGVDQSQVEETIGVFQLNRPFLGGTAMLQMKS